MERPGFGGYDRRAAVTLRSADRAPKITSNHSEARHGAARLGYSALKRQQSPATLLMTGLCVAPLLFVSRRLPWPQVMAQATDRKITAMLSPVSMAPKITKDEIRLAIRAYSAAAVPAISRAKLINSFTGVSLTLSDCYLAAFLAVCQGMIGDGASIASRLWPNPP
jgi:hypothetical protein